MPTNYSSRITIILIVLFGSILGIISPAKLFDSSIPWSRKTNLKPGIDIAGGESLVYEIKVPPGSDGRGSSGQSLAEEVSAALKKRVDPNGLMNLVWRPEGDTRLEIQIPRALDAGKRDEARKALITAQEELKKTNLNVADVKAAIEKLSGPERDKKLTELAAGSADRLKQLNSLAALYDQIQKAKADLAAAEKANNTAAKNKAADAQVLAEIQYDKELKNIESSNLSLEEMQSILDLPADKPELRNQRLAELKDRYKGFDARIRALDKLNLADAEFKKYKGQLEGAIDLKRMLRGSGVLEFHILVTNLESPEAQQMRERLLTKGPAPQAGDTMKWFKVDNLKEFGGHTTFPLKGDPDTRYVLAYITLDKQMVHNRNANAWALQSAQPSRDQSGGNAVGFTFDPQGAKLFGDLTRNNIHLPLGIVLDDRMISAPNLLHEIGAEGIITGGTGGFEPQQMKYLVNTLSAGSLPATLADEPVSERTVSPQLGVDNLYRGLLASLIGLVVVSIFLVGYYHIAGLVAFFAVIMNLIIILGVLAMFGATFTMPSIAGIVLTVGTAIDANVLVFERMREEEHRGHPLKMALQHAYDRALSAIVDSNMTTAITSLCLYVFGSEEVKGFGLTLLIGIVSSLFTALFVTKTIFAILIDKYGLKELGSVPTKYPKWDKLLHPKIDWMGMIWPFITFSTIFIVAGLSAFIVKKRDMFDVEFASGTTVQIELKDDSGLPLQKVRDLINQRSQQIPAASVVSINNSDKNYEIVTPSDKASVVRDAVLDVMGPYLKIERPSKFDQTGLKLEDALNKSVIPIDKETLEIDGKPIAEAASYVGGVAVVLRNLDPPISPNEVHSRIDRAATAPGSETNLGKWRVEVVGLNNDTSKDKNNNPSKDVVVLAMNPDFPYAKSAEGWKESTAVPMWRLINEGVNREAKLQKVSNFDPQVASGTRWQAFFATAFSIVAIMVYIWFRFGDLKYATATVVALIHDTLAVIGAVGLSHYLDNGFGHMFLIEPFRINLTLVAAILTIMGYSMIDTIVVFDRIRENRGRYGKISRKVINDSINQTLSRTLLTAGTTLVMVAVMYFCGGSGIHGFTFVLLVGILIGTYSSVAIAAPILLIGSDEESKRPEAVIERKSPIGQAQRAGADLTAVKRT